MFHALEMLTHHEKPRIRQHAVNIRHAARERILARQHIGVYAYRRAALDRFVTLPASPLELREKLEQLRALEAGMKISAARVEHGPFGVDTPEDLERARALLAP